MDGFFVCDKGVNLRYWAPKKVGNMVASNLMVAPSLAEPRRTVCGTRTRKS